MLRVINKSLWRTVEGGEMLPPWYYALGHIDYIRHRAYFYPIPIAVVVRLYYAVQREWNHVRATPFRWEK